MTVAARPELLATGPKALFSRVLVGVDGSHEAREAARQAAVLTEAGGELTLLAVYGTVLALATTTGTTPRAAVDADLPREAAADALRRAQAELAGRPATGKIVQGVAWDELIRELEREQDTLVVVGSHGNGRARGIVMGSTATGLVHKAPCSVLVTRAGSGERFPEAIVVGVDGSPASATAYAAARYLAGRFRATLWPVVAHGSHGVDDRLATLIAGERHEDLLDEPVTALVAAAGDADLLVVGSRGLHGLKSIGSVSERVAHRARTSVLIVREPAWQRIAEELER
jgi:nucleotide-binding universal stress UspA family protein